MSRRQLTLLLLEDSPEDRHVFRTYLEQVEEYSFRFLEEENAEQALEVCKREPVDCILLDYELPGANGLEFLRRLEIDEGLLRPPVVMVTGRGSERIAVKALRGGASDYLVKAEVTPENLYRAVRNAVEKEDIRKRLTEQRLRTGLAESRLQLALEVLEHGDALIVLDKDGRVVLVNSNQERISRKPRDETLMRRVCDLWPLLADPKTKFWSEYQRAMRERVPVHFEEFYAPMDLWVDVSVYPTKEGGLAAFFRDISERKRKEEDARAEERRRSEFEQQLIGIVSHDLRNPITAISLGISLLLRREGLDERILKTLVRIHSSAERAIRMVRDLLDFTQARLGGGIVLHREQMDLHTLLHHVVEEVHMSYPEREVRVEVSGSGVGTWDSDRVAQVITNLVTNALKYSPGETPVTVRTRGEANSVVMEVHNLGEPIPPQLQAHLFEPMRRGGENSDRTSRSIGLGLFIVDHIIRAHGGTIDVRSNALDGTTFCVRLPRSPASA
ncbi:response regulator [Archangium violaceum]|uniref:sensor histidine kinase n=1 Tax=Archangium violaceum TaxID=83451 RepID=UPI00193BE00E|nr:ATP-binding protein [Archangium violaceum]QRK08793.1 response regulator [Archangium violaceum]